MICTEMYPLHFFLWHFVRENLPSHGQTEHFESTFYSNKVHGGEQDSLAPERMATASLFFGRHLMICLNPPNPLFKGAHQGLRAFHRHKAATARQLRPGI